jgi:hypothetical protein
MNTGSLKVALQVIRANLVFLTDLGKNSDGGIEKSKSKILILQCHHNMLQDITDILDPEIDKVYCTLFECSDEFVFACRI